MSGICSRWSKLTCGSCRGVDAAELSANERLGSPGSFGLSSGLHLLHAAHLHAWAQLPSARITCLS